MRRADGKGTEGFVGLHEWMNLGLECEARACGKKGFDCIGLHEWKIQLRLVDGTGVGVHQANGTWGWSESSEWNVGFECDKQIEKGV